MRTFLSRRLSPHRMVWLLLFALLMPLAQTMASMHVLSHVRLEQASAPAPPASSSLDRCDLCLNAAALIAGAPLVASFAPVLGVMPQALVRQPASASFVAAVQPVYQSRAPPFLQV
ncbi:MAG: hypothetical protein H7346_19300 [Burkholderiaceae bacterium]|nr:hypothetical protein [Burkholderiaceae bacterium]